MGAGVSAFVEETMLWGLVRGFESDPYQYSRGESRPLETGKGDVIWRGFPAAVGLKGYAASFLFFLWGFLWVIRAFWRKEQSNESHFLGCLSSNSKSSGGRSVLWFLEVRIRRREESLWILKTSRWCKSEGMWSAQRSSLRICWWKTIDPFSFSLVLSLLLLSALGWEIQDVRERERTFSFLQLNSPCAKKVLQIAWYPSNSEIYGNEYQIRGV